MATQTGHPMRSGACNLRPEPTSSNLTWFYPQLGSNKREFREHVNTLLLQGILCEEKWQKRLTDADRRALSPLFWTHVNPYGRFRAGHEQPPRS